MGVGETILPAPTQDSKHLPHSLRGGAIGAVSHEEVEQMDGGWESRHKAGLRYRGSN